MQILRATQNKIVVYYTTKKQEQKRKKTKEKKKITEDNRTKGVLSQKAKARMKNCIQKLVGAYTIGQYGDKWRFFLKRLSLNFVTLTLPSRQIHTDKEIKRTSLAAFLQILQEKYRVSSYVWRAEKQCNGNIHFHIIINRNIHWSYIRKEWNQCIERLGYISAYQDKFQKFTLSEYLKYRNPKTQEELAKVIRAYNRSVSEAWTNPNTTDIHRIEKIFKLEAYIAKYMAKDNKEDNLKVEGHLWGRSDNLEAIPHFETVPEPKDIKKLKEIKETSHCFYTKEKFFELYYLIDLDVFDLCFIFTNKFIQQMQYNYNYIEGRTKEIKKISII